MNSTQRIARDIESLGVISEVQGIGCTRYTYTKEFKEARDYIIAQMKEAGLKVREDAVGSIIGRLEGTDPGLPIIMTGSHFDTVKTGGRFDGAAGAVAALETARRFYEEGFKPRRSIEFVALPEEEGARFGGGLFASRAMCGQLYPNEVFERKDANGITMAEAMKDYGLDPAKTDDAIRPDGQLGMFLELHIEQGPVLEKEGIDVGLVEAIVGLECYVLKIHGRSDHAGNTPMDMRADTMLAAAKAITAATEKAIELQEGTVVTFGRVETIPGAFNIVAKETELSIDCRSKTLENVHAVIDTLKASLEQSIRENPGLSYELTRTLDADPVLSNEYAMELMEKLAGEEGLSCRRMLSGAGHDAMIMASKCPVAMIFVPSKEGRSHVPEEWTDYDQLEKGARLLYRCVKELAMDEDSTR